MIRFNMVALAAILATAPAWADQEKRPRELFAGMTCEDVASRAQVIMRHRQLSGSYEIAFQHLRKTHLDLTLINDAFEVGHKIDAIEIFTAIDDFERRWRKICEASLE